MPKPKLEKKENIILIISAITLFLLLYQTFISESKTTKILGDIVENTDKPIPYLNGYGQCYLIDQFDVNRYFLINGSSSLYADIFILETFGTYATDPWIKVKLPSGLEYIDYKTIPEAKVSFGEEKDYQGNSQKIMSYTWDYSITPGDNVKVIIIYDKKYFGELKNNFREYTYGSREKTGYTSFISCYNIEIFPGFDSSEF